MLPSWLAGSVPSSWIFSQLFLRLSQLLTGTVCSQFEDLDKEFWEEGLAPSDSSVHQRAPRGPHLLLASLILSTQAAAVLVTVPRLTCPPADWLLPAPGWCFDAVSLPRGLCLLSSPSRWVSHSWHLVACPSPPFWLYSSWSPKSGGIRGQIKA